MCAYILRVCVGDGVRVGDGLVGERAYGGCFQCIFTWSGLHLFLKRGWLQDKRVYGQCV